MKIAVPFEDGQVFQHFGRSAQFKFYEAENGQLLRTEVIPTNGQGHGALAGFLVQHGADVVLCGGIGTGAQVALMQAGIQRSAAFPAPQTPLWPTIWPESWSSTRTSTAPTTTMTRATAAAPTAGAGATDIPDTPSASATMSR